MDLDRIERDIDIAAPIERVWKLLTEPEHIAGWFSDTARLDRLAPGATLLLGWKEFGEYPAVVERVDQPHLFSFRWTADDNDHPGSAAEEPGTGNSTLVEFHLEPREDRTRLRVVETGFAALRMSDDKQRAYRAQNEEGWDIELGELQQYVASWGQPGDGDGSSGRGAAGDASSGRSATGGASSGGPAAGDG